MKISQKRLLEVTTFVVFFLIPFESIITKLDVDTTFSLYYSLPILLCMYVLDHFLKKERFYIIPFISYLIILFMTALSLIKLLMFYIGVGYIEATMLIIPTFSVFLNVLMMSFAILQFRQYIKWQRASSKSA